MNIEQLREYCLSKKGVSESFPFGEDALVFKVGSKMFALISISGDLSINLKCDPDKAVELREHYEFIKPGYHMNKTHWNTVEIIHNANEKLIYELIDDSYNLVFNNLPNKEKEKIKKQT